MKREEFVTDDEGSEIVSRISEFLKKIVDTSNVPGISVSACLDDLHFNACAGVRRRGSPGALRADDRFEIGCLAKLFTSMLFMKLAQRGILDLEEDVASSLGDASLEDSGIRIRHLLSCTSGLQGIRGDDARVSTDPTWRQLLDDLGRVPRLFRPGEAFNYHLLDHVLAGELARRRTGVRVKQLIEDIVLRPLGIQAEHPDGERDMPACGHVWEGTTKRYVPIGSRPIGDIWHPAISRRRLSTREMLKVAVELVRGSRDYCRKEEDSRPVEYAPLATRVLTLPGMRQGVWEYRRPLGPALGLVEYFPGCFGQPGASAGGCCSIAFVPSHGIALAIALNAPLVHIRDGILTILLQALGFEIDTSETRGSLQRVAVHDLEGNYVGGTRDTSLVARRGGDKLLVDVVEGKGLLQTLEIQIDDEDRVSSHQGVTASNICFHRSGESGSPCVSLGWQTYLKARG